MYATAYTPVSITIDTRDVTGDWLGAIYNPAARAIRRRFTTQDIASTVAPLTAEQVEIRDLIRAAGPLTIDDIAGGLDVLASRASSVIRSLVTAGRMREDEWGRYRFLDDSP